MNSPLELAAMEFAYQMHRTQVDKQDKPYFLHVMRVAMTVARDGADVVCVAFLHDVVEDCFVPLEVIHERYGPTIGAAVDSLTRRSGEKYEDYIERCAQNPIARRVKFADLMDNMMEARMALLDKPDQLRLRKRYGAALARLEGL